MNSFFSKHLALLFALVLVINPLIASAADRVRITADPCGPMAALQRAGHSTRLVPFLQHKDGTLLLPSEVRTAPDKYFYLPAGARVDAAMFATFLKSEIETFGAPPKGGCVEKGPTCEDDLASANRTIGHAKEALDAAEKRAKAAEAALAAERERNRGRVPWWLLLFLIPIAGLAYLFYLFARRRGQADPQLQQQLADEQAAGQALDRLVQELQTRIATLEYDVVFQMRRADAYEETLRNNGINVPIVDPNPPAAGPRLQR